MELAGIGVPTLTEVLAAMPSTTLIDLELKEQPTDDLFATLVAARGPEAEGVVLSSFHPGALKAVDERAPDWSRWLNAETAAEAEQAVQLGCAGLSVAMDLLNDASISRWRDAGLDAALLPEAPGVNPQASVMAVAIRNARRYCADRAG